MRSSRTEKPEKPNRRATSALAKALAPEDIRPGDFVTLLNVTCELPSFFWDGDSALGPRDQPVRIRFVPESGGVPLKVKSICLPFVLVKHPWAGKQSLDLRKCRLARLDRAYASEAWKAYKRAKPKAEANNCL